MSRVTNKKASNKEWKTNQ